MSSHLHWQTLSFLNSWFHGKIHLALTRTEGSLNQMQALRFVNLRSKKSFHIWFNWHWLCCSFSSTNLKAMKLVHFQSLSQSTQREVAKKKGGLLLKKQYAEFKVLLYQLHSFYIEIYFQPLSKKAILVKSFSSVDELEPYLEDIQLPSFL